MPKSKKRKTNHQSSTHNGDLTHEEIWDDSALIRSWNDAVAEYEFYHSIHAKGEDVDEVLRKYEEDQQDLNQNQAQDQIEDQDQNTTHPTKPAPSSNVNADIDIEEGELEDNPINENPIQETTIPSNPKTISKPDSNPPTNSNPTTTSTSTSTSTIHPTPQIQPTQSSNPNQTLENLKMAYYWAGYYSGLHDGQQVQNQPHPPT